MRYIITDFLIIGFIYLIPTASHLTSLPLYLFEPMRFALVFAILFTNRNNSFIIALTLPVISILVSSHANTAKGLLIVLELSLNAIVFYFFLRRINSIFIVMFISILVAKIIYYLSKFLFLNLGIINGDLISTPLWIQYLVIILLSVFAGVTLRDKKEDLN